ncbi:MAG TPA: hypothetical protein VEY06_07300, partial [Flavisolibacter sp.]|nr:hypothetical protein [Flavisolibacter sp.]
MEENQINNPNADVQEQGPVAEQATGTATAITNEPVGESDNSQGSISMQNETPGSVTGENNGTENTPVAEPISEVKIEEPVEETLAAHDDFDWSIDKRNVASYTQEEKVKYDSVYEN